MTAAAYTVPTDAPEADGTLAWDSVTLVLAQVRAGGEQGIGWTYGSPACAAVISGMLAGVVHGRPALDVPGTSEAMIRAARNITRSGLVQLAWQRLPYAMLHGVRGDGQIVVHPATQLEIKGFAPDSAGSTEGVQGTLKVLSDFGDVTAPKPISVYYDDSFVRAAKGG